MKIIHMDTDAVRATAQQFNTTLDEIEGCMNAVQQSLQRLDWQSPSRDEYSKSIESMMSSYKINDEKGRLLAQQLHREVNEWESADNQFGTGEIAPLAWVPVILVGVALVGFGFPLWWYGQTLEGKSQDEAYDTVEKILSRSKSGRDALQQAKDLGVEFKLSGAGSGTYYDSGTNTMYVDPKSQQDSAASGFIHELEHAKQHHNNEFLDPTKTTKEDFVTRCIQNEADAKIAEFRYQNENFMLDKMSEPEYETAYWKAYQQKLVELKQSDPYMAQDEMGRIANETGRDEIIQAYRNGDIKTSTTGQSYVDYYGDGWDRANEVM